MTFHALWNKFRVRGKTTSGFNHKHEPKGASVKLRRVRERARQVLLGKIALRAAMTSRGILLEWHAPAVGHCVSGKIHLTAQKRRATRAAASHFLFPPPAAPVEMIKYTINLTRQLGLCDIHLEIPHVRAGQLFGDGGEGKKINHHFVSFKWYWSSSN